jgi:hypothetical protein
MLGRVAVVYDVEKMTLMNTAAFAAVATQRFMQNTQRSSVKPMTLHMLCEPISFHPGINIGGPSSFTLPCQSSLKGALYREERRGLTSSLMGAVGTQIYLNMPSELGLWYAHKPTNGLPGALFQDYANTMTRRKSRPSSRL